MRATELILHKISCYKREENTAEKKTVLKNLGKVHYSEILNTADLILFFVT